MSRPIVAVLLAFGVAVGGCSKIVELTGIVGSNPLSIDVATTILAGDTVQATAVSVHPGNDRRPVTATWRTSDASVISIDGSGRMVGHIEGRSATIFADYQGQTASALVTVRSGDNRFGYALADQPNAAGPYSPDAAYRYNSSGGVIEVTRASAGVYSVRFAGLGRESGERDNVQVTAYGATGLYCKPANLPNAVVPGWGTVGSDLIAPVNCFATDGTPTDSRFTILLMGAQAFGSSTPVGFVLAYGDTGTTVMDTTLTARNSTGGHIYIGRVSEGNYAIQFKGIGSASAGKPIALEATAVGAGLRRCRIGAVDQSTDGVNVLCARAGGGVGDSPFSLLWFTRGRANLRYGFAWANNAASAVDYSPDPTFAFNSAGGSIAARRTGIGQFRVVFGGLGRPPGATENVQLSLYQTGPAIICNITSWGNTGVNDLAVTVACYDLTGAPTNNALFNVLVVQ